MTHITRPFGWNNRPAHLARAVQPPIFQHFSFDCVYAGCGFADLAKFAIAHRAFQRFSIDSISLLL